MGHQTEGRDIFVVRILNTQNSTWQGTVTWLDKSRTKPFRSALEMIHLIDSALPTQERAGSSAPHSEENYKYKPSKD